MLIGLGEQNILVAAQGCLAAQELLEMIAPENLVHGLDAVDALRVALGRHMAER